MPLWPAYCTPRCDCQPLIPLSFAPQSQQAQSTLRRSGGGAGAPLGSVSAVLRRLLAFATGRAFVGSKGSAGGALLGPGFGAGSVEPAGAALLDVAKTSCYRVTNTFGPVLRGPARAAAAAMAREGAAGAAGAAEALEAFLAQEM